MTIYAPPERQSWFVLFLRQLWGMALRHIYLHLGSWPRLIEMLYWPIINMSIWGFVSLYLVKNLSNAVIVGNIFIAGVLLSEVFLRVLVTVLMLFLEEIWSRNFGHLFASPIRFSGYITSVVGLALTRAAISLTPAILIAKPLFGFSLFSLGWPVAGYILLLAINGCWYGFLIVAMLFRYGLAAEWLAWMGTMLLIPLVAPYYPVSILPDWLQVISLSLPGTYVFESMKSLIGQHELHGEYLWKALGLNIVYFIGSSFILVRAYQGARRRGGLLQVGE